MRIVLNVLVMVALSLMTIGCSDTEPAPEDPDANAAKTTEESEKAAEEAAKEMQR